MAEQIRGIKRVEKVRGKDVEGKVRVLERTYPHQLMLFQTFIPEDDPDDKYSNTIELYDAIPKYFSNARAMDAMRKDGIYLPTLERVFQHRQETYTVQIRPARVRGRTGAEKEYYPSPREELVEEALRKLACDKMNGVYLDNSTVVFCHCWRPCDTLRPSPTPCVKRQMAHAASHRDSCSHRDRPRGHLSRSL